MSSDGAVTDRIADAEQSKSLIDLIIIKKALIGLVHRTAGDLAGTGGAGTSTTGIGQVNTCFFNGIENILVRGTLNGLSFAFGGLNCDFIHGDY